MSETTKKILVLGSGMVAPPCVDYLTRNPKNQVTIACRTLISAEKLASRFPRTNAISLDVSSAIDLNKHVSTHDIVISLVPYIYHAGVIKSAIKSETHVVTTSYVSEATRALDAAAKQAGITVFNEVGVDPGVDHLYAIKKINEVHAKGGKVREFYSYCGGLPAPDCANNPLGFKFSWSPRGALLSQRNSARYLQNGRIVDISSADLMATAKPHHVMEGYDFVAYSNRDSVRSELAKFPTKAESERIISGMKWMGILSSEKATVAGGNLLDTLCARLEKLMSFQPGERDLVMLQHKFGIEWAG
ncbi:MAG: hypothetical protein Q9214_002655, partial [Letrouitia sp. 1 TL-2023]